MRLCVPILSSTRQTPFAPVAALCLAALSACTTTPPATTTDTSTSGNAAITVTLAPEFIKSAAGPFAGTITVTGTFTLDKGVTLVKSGPVVATLGDNISTTCAVKGSAFTCLVDTIATDPSGNAWIGCNETPSLTVTVSGSQAGADVSGSASQDVEVDNCPPVLTLMALDADHNPLPIDPALTFVDSQWIRFSVSDARLDSASFDVQGGAPADDGTVPSILTSGPLTLPAGQTNWHQDYLLDTTRLGATEALTVVLTAQDKTNAPASTSLSLFTVKSPLFLGTTTDHYSHAIRDFVIPQDPDAAPNNSIVGFTTDPTPTSGMDKLTDVVVATNVGVFIRAGMPKRDAAGVPVDVNGNELTDPDTDAQVHSLKFEDINPDEKMYNFRSILGTAAEQNQHAVADIQRVFLRDLDGDSDLDIIAVGSVSGDGPTRGEVWAILNVPATVNVPVTATTTDATGAPTSTALKLRAFKLVDTLQLPAPPRTAELADLNADGLDDLLIGALKTTDANGKDLDLGLMTLLLTPSPVCDLNDGTTGVPCTDDNTAVTYDSLKAGHIFTATVKVAPNEGVTGVSSIASGDFYSGGGIDVCVGSADRPIVSCYRNVLQDGTLNQAQDGYQFIDGNDTELIQAIDETPGTDSDGTDLVVYSSSGQFLRWLKTTQAGTFTYIENKAITNRDIWPIGMSVMTVGPVGPKGDPYVVIGMGAVAIVSVDPKDATFLDDCFRSWVVGGTQNALQVGDIDGDSVPDIVAADNLGLQVAIGQTQKGVFTGDFIAPHAYHICYAPYPTGIPNGVNPIALSKVADFTKDDQRELLLFGAQSIGAKVNQKQAAWPMAVFINENGQLNPKARTGEYSPYDPDNRDPNTLVTAAGLTSDTDPFGVITAAAVADFDGDGYNDVVTVRTGSSYAIGKAVISSPNACQCYFDETNEVANSFGEDGPTSTDPTQPPPPSLCCFNFAPSDTAKGSPIHGFGGSGAPLLRASGNLFMSSKTGPLGLKATYTEVVPAYSFAAGRNPVDVIAVDIDGKNGPDIITAMDDDGKQCIAEGDGGLGNAARQPFLQARMRAFRNTGLFKPNQATTSLGFFQPTFIPTGLTVQPPPDRVQILSCEDPTAEVPLEAVSYRIMPDGISALATGPWPNFTTGALDPATIFGLGAKYGQVGIVPHVKDKTGFDFGPHSSTPVGGIPEAFAISDVNGDGVADMLVLSNVGNTVAILTGIQVSAFADAAFQTQTSLSVSSSNFPGAVATAMGDVNNDTFLDLVLVSKDSQVMFMLGTGTGQFVLYKGSPLADIPIALEIADMDADGCADLVIRGKVSVMILQNEGTSPGDCSAALRWAHDTELANEANPTP